MKRWPSQRGERPQPRSAPESVPITKEIIVETASRQIVHGRALPIRSITRAG